MTSLHPDEVKLIAGHFACITLLFLALLLIVGFVRRWFAYRRTGRFGVETKVRLSRDDKRKLIALPFQIPLAVGLIWFLSQFPAGWQRDLAHLGLVCGLLGLVWVLLRVAQRRQAWHLAEAERAERFGRPPRKRRCD